MLRIIIWIIAVIAVLIVGVLLLGLATPKAHIASGEALINVQPGMVESLVAAPEHYTSWRKGVEKVEAVRQDRASLYWREKANGDAIDYRLDIEVPERRLRTTILSKDLPYGGYWIIELEPVGAQTRVRVTEHGVVTNVVFRGLGRLFFPHDTTLKAYLRDLQARTAQG